MNIISKVTINGKTRVNGRYVNLTGRVFKIHIIFMSKLSPK